MYAAKPHPAAANCTLTSNVTLTCADDTGGMLVVPHMLLTRPPLLPPAVPAVQTTRGRRWMPPPAWPTKWTCERPALPRNVPPVSGCGALLAAGPSSIGLVRQRLPALQLAPRAQCQRLPRGALKCASRRWDWLPLRAAAVPLTSSGAPASPTGFSHLPPAESPRLASLPWPAPHPHTSHCTRLPSTAPPHPRLCLTNTHPFCARTTALPPLPSTHPAARLALGEQRRFLLL